MEHRSHAQHLVNHKFRNAYKYLCKYMETRLFLDLTEHRDAAC